MQIFGRIAAVATLFLAAFQLSAVANVLYAIGNSAQADLLPAAAACLEEADPVVADAARWAVSRLTAPSA